MHLERGWMDLRVIDLTKSVVFSFPDVKRMREISKPKGVYNSEAREVKCNSY